jgi:hypothetical protein
VGKMGRIKLVIVLIALAFPVSIHAKTSGNYKSHQQITDKEVLFETTKGVKILLSAEDDYTIGVRFLGKNEIVKLNTPEHVRSKKTSLKGSIYLEEIHDKIQVTTTMDDGLFIIIEKNPFKLSYLQKENNQLLTSESKGINFGKLGPYISFYSESNKEKFEVVSRTKSETLSNTLEMGESICIADGDVDTNEFVLVSSNGYSIVFKNESRNLISLNKNSELAVQSFGKEKDQFSYKLLFGSAHNDYVERLSLERESEKSVLSVK